MDNHAKKQMILYRLFPPRKRIQTLSEYLEETGGIDGKEEPEEVTPKRSRNHYDIYPDENTLD